MPNSTPYTHRWQQARVRFLREHPLCVYCAEVGRTTPATVVDHIVPHKGDQERFWDEHNWQPLCATCHNSVKQAEEHTGQRVGHGVDGLPVESAHHWSRGGGA